MTGPSSREAVIEGILAGLSTGDVDATRAATIRRRMHDRLEQNARRRASMAGRWRRRPPLRVRAAMALAALLLYVGGVIRHALAFYGR